jgi:hypothetical protein
VKLHLFDGKYVELAPWAGCAEHMIGPNQDEAIDVLKELVADMDGRYMQLLANKRRKLRPEDGLALHVVEIDELAFFCNGPDRAANKAFTELARDLVGRGRAAGYIVKAATQKPSGDTIPTYLRDLFAVRWAFRCSTSDASDTILGKGWAKGGYSADSIDRWCSSAPTAGCASVSWPGCVAVASTWTPAPWMWPRRSWRSRVGCCSGRPRPGPAAAGSGSLAGWSRSWRCTCGRRAARPIRCSAHRPAGRYA